MNCLLQVYVPGIRDGIHVEATKQYILSKRPNIYLDLKNNLEDFFLVERTSSETAGVNITSINYKI